MMPDTVPSVAPQDDDAWALLVDAALPTVWSTTLQWHLPTAEAAAVCDSVLLRLVDTLAASRLSSTAGMPSFTELVRQLAVKECERSCRLEGRGERPSLVIDLTEGYSRVGGRST